MSFVLISNSFAWRFVVIVAWSWIRRMFAYAWLVILYCARLDVTLPQQFCSPVSIVSIFWISVDPAPPGPSLCSIFVIWFIIAYSILRIAIVSFWLSCTVTHSCCRICCVVDSSFLLPKLLLRPIVQLPIYGIFSSIFTESGQFNTSLF